MSTGYGMFRRNKVYYLAHRASYSAFKGEVPDGLSVLHTCDTPACINPKHLRLGTQADNMQDCANKNRIHRPTVRGDRHPTTKVAFTDVLKIRKSKLELHTLAGMYGVTVRHIRSIKNNETRRTQ